MTLTPKDAITILENFDTYGAATVATKMAVDALEKQIPKKMIVYKDEEIEEFACPCCGNALFRQIYCEACGQRVEEPR